MKSKKILFLAVLLLAIYQLCQTNIRAGDKWLKISSENFRLMGDASEKDLRQTAFKLEKFREAFAGIFPDLKFTSPVPTDVIVFASENSFNLYKPVNGKDKSPENSAGYFLNGEDVNYIVVSAGNVKSDSFRNIYHQYTHFLLNNNPGKSKIPPWLYEGIAQYMEDFQITEDGKASFGNIRQDSFDAFRDDKFIPFETFFSIDYYKLHQQEKEGEGLFYAQSRVLTHYLLNFKREGFSRFINLIQSGQPPREAFIKAFQTNFADLEKDLKQYAGQKSFQTSQTTLNKKIVFDGLAAPISNAEINACLGDLLYHLNRIDEAEKYLKQALNINPDLSTALAALGLVKAKQFNDAEAQDLVEKAIKNAPQDYLNYFRYAYVLSRKGMTDYGFVSGYNFAAADKMRDALKKAIELEPNFAESYNLYALISFVRNDELDESLQYIEKARQIAPGNQQYLIRLAELNMRKEKFTEARQNALSVLQNASEPSLRLYAQNTIQRIDSTEEQLFEIRRDKGKYINDDSVTDVPMSDEEVARRRARAVLESIRNGLRRPADGQKRIAGALVNIECTPKQVNFVVKTDNDTVNLQAASLEGINLITYNQNMFGAEIGCGAIKKENNAVIIYQAANDSKSNALGIVVSIEFVPKEFKLLGKN